MSATPNNGQTTGQTSANRTVGVSNLGGDSVALRQLDANSGEQRRQIRVNDTSLMSGEWEQLDTAVMEEAMRPLTLVNEIEGSGLTTDVGMDITESTWTVRSGEFTAAEMTMDPRENAEEDAPAFARDGVPIPIIHKDYRIGERELRVSRRDGTGIDTAYAQDASRVVAELLEQQILNGWDATFNSNLTLYGLRNHPDRNTMLGSDWSIGENVKADMLAMIHALEDDNFYSDDAGYWLILADDQFRHLRRDYKPTVDVSMTTEEKITDEMGEVDRVIRSQYLPNGEAIMFKPVSSVFDLARDPAGIQNIQWESHGGFESRFKVMSIQAPRVKSTYNGNSGLLHVTGLS